jgi:hypothetical protein
MKHLGLNLGLLVPDPFPSPFPFFPDCFSGRRNK